MKKTKKILPFFVTHQGCPWRCTFCDQRVIEGASPSMSEALERLERELSSIATPPDQIAFYGGDFLNMNEEVIRSTISEVERMTRERFGLRVGYRASCTPEALTEEKLELARNLGFETIEVGVVSTDEEVLRRAGRNCGKKAILEAIRACMRAGFEVGVQFVSGLPGDDHGKFSRSLNDVLSQKPNFARLYPLVVIEGTPLGDMVKRGEFEPRDDSYHLWAAAIFVAACARWGVEVARVGLHLGDAVQNKIISLPSVSNLRQEGEGIFLEFVLTEIFEVFGDTVRVVVPKKYETSLKGKGRRRLEALLDKWRNRSCSVEFAEDGEFIRVFKYNDTGDVIFRLSYFAENFINRVLREG